MNTQRERELCDLFWVCFIAAILTYTLAMIIAPNP